MDRFFIKPRIDYLKYFSGETMIFSDPDFRYFINTMGAYYNPFQDNKVVGIVKPLGIPRSMPDQFMPKGPNIDGPYESEEHMKVCSPAYSLIIEPNPEKATQILLKSIHRKMSDHFNKYFVPDFIQSLPFILDHTFIGNRRDGLITGLHFLTSDLRIKGYAKGDYKSKVPFANIEKVDQMTGKVYPKKRPSTFWPSKWDIERCVIECAIAWSNKTKNTNNDNYAGYTSDGLKITFCFSKGQLKTVYPDFNNNES